jgi:hypothetical protein
MIKEVDLKGLQQNPSDHEAADGQLGTCLNLIKEDGVLKPILPGVKEETFSLPNDTCSIPFVHSVTYGDVQHKHYIINCSNGSPYRWYWTEKGGDGAANEISLGAFEVKSINAVGNVLCFVGAATVKYAIWNNNGGYTIFDRSTFDYTYTLYKKDETDIECPIVEEWKKLFDIDVPDVDKINDTDAALIQITNENAWSFFSGKQLSKAEFLALNNPVLSPLWKSYSHYDYWYYLTHSNAAYNTELWALLAAKMNKKVSAEGKTWLHSRIYGVIAVKLYDGTYINISDIFELSPAEMPHILKMHSNARCAEMVDDEIEKTNIWAFLDKYSIYREQIHIWLTNINSIPDSLVDCVDVFVTTPQHLYDMDNGIDIAQVYALFRDISLPKKEFLGFSMQFSDRENESLHKAFDGLTFYKSISIPFNTLKETSNLTYIERPADTEETINLSDFYRSEIGGNVATVYNNRLHIGDTQTSLPTVFSPSRFLAPTYDTVVDVEVQEMGLTHHAWFKGKMHLTLPSVLMYAYPNAKRMTIYTYVQEGNGVRAKYYLYKNSYILDTSDFWGMSFNMSLSKRELNNDDAVIATAKAEVEKMFQQLLANCTDTATITANNVIKLSEAENPLVFPAANSVVVGNGTVTAMTSNTHAISQGQFGDAPLYAFTNEGTWMLMLDANKTGTYAARQPVNRDVLLSKDGVVQTDGAVIYTTSTGLKRIEGSTTKEIGDVMDGYPFHFSELPNAQKILDLRGFEARNVDYAYWREYLNGSKMTYDYHDQRIILFNSEYTYAYVYSLKSGMWGSMKAGFRSCINAYPNALIVDKDNNIINVYNSGHGINTDYLVCTRPVALGEMDVRKTLQTLIGRGFFRKGRVGLVVWGSNDLYNWFTIGTSQDHYLRGISGTGYKYFRICLTGLMADDESLNSLTFDIHNKITNRLR